MPVLLLVLVSRDVLPTTYLCCWAGARYTKCKTPTTIWRTFSKGVQYGGVHLICSISFGNVASNLGEYVGHPTYLFPLLAKRAYVTVGAPGVKNRKEVNDVLVDREWRRFAVEFIFVL